MKHLSKETLEYHFMWTLLNSLIPDTPFEAMTLEEIITEGREGKIFNNAAQVWKPTWCNG